MAELCNVLSIPRAHRIFAAKKFDANCVGTDAVGDCVVITGVAVAGLFQVQKFDPRVLSYGPSVGVIIEKATATLCVVQQFGLMDGIYTGMTPGAQLWAGLDARLKEGHSTVTPSAGKAFAQQMGQAMSDDVVWLNIQQPLVKVSQP